jgi:L-iditol 2-dehydrogenase
VRAAVYLGAGRLEVQEWPEPRLAPGELLLRLRGCGLCGSDIAKVARDTVVPPAVLGHEVVGDVVEVGAGAAPHWKVGDRVVAAHHVPCFDCHYCRRGSPSMCRGFKRLNLDPGGFAEVLRVPAPNVAHATFRLPPAMADETASFTEPLACCLRAVKRTRAGTGDTALVVGLGSIGCLLVQAFRLAGARVFGADLLAARRRLAAAFGAETFEDEAALAAALLAATAGRGADVTVLTAGGAAAVGAAARAVRDGGQVHCFAGGGDGPLPVSLDTLYHRELTLGATYSSSPAELAQAFAHLESGRVTVGGLITHRLPLTRLADAVTLMRRQEAVKVYVTP